MRLVRRCGQSITTYRHIILDGHQVKWGSPAAGTGAVVTYALLDAARDFPGARNCGAMAPIAPLLAANDVSARAFDTELRAAFALWSAAANIQFVPAVATGSADLLIGAQAKPRGRAFTNVEYEATGPNGGVRRLTRSLICLSPEHPWKIGFDGNLEIYDLRYALLHEIGHAIGLDHPAIAGVLMDFRYLEEFRAPQNGDILGAVALYGPSRNADRRGYGIGRGPAPRQCEGAAPGSRRIGVSRSRRQNPRQSRRRRNRRRRPHRTRASPRARLPRRRHRRRRTSRRRSCCR